MEEYEGTTKNLLETMELSRSMYPRSTIQFINVPVQ